MQENKDYARNYLTIADRDLASEVRRKLIESAADQMDKGFDSDLAGYTVRTLAIMKKDVS